MEEEPVTLFEGNGCEAKYGLGVGAPDKHALYRVAQLINTTTQHRLAEDASQVARIIQYGRPEGDPRFRRAVAQFLTENYGDTVNQKDLVATAGASSGLFYVLNQLFPSKCKIFCDQFSYFIALDMMRELQYPVVSVAMANDGIDVEALEAAFERELGTPNTPEPPATYAAMLFLVPIYHNPTGTVLAKEKCAKIITLARKYNVLVLCDDVYNLLWYTKEKHPPKRLFAYDSPSDPDYKGNVVSNGSFSKLLGPGLRIGWMEMPPVLLNKIWLNGATLNSGGCLNMYMSAIIAKALEENTLQQLVLNVRKENAERMQTVVRVLQQHLPKNCTFIPPQGGYFIWITMGPGMDSTAVLKKAMEIHDLKFQVGPKFFAGSTMSDSASRSLRISIAYHDTNVLKEAALLLCELIETMSTNV